MRREKFCLETVFVKKDIGKLADWKLNLSQQGEIANRALPQLVSKSWEFTVLQSAWPECLTSTVSSLGLGKDTEMEQVLRMAVRMIRNQDIRSQKKDKEN